MKYSQIIGSLMYLASATRPDISFAVSKLSRFVSKPGDVRWKALERVCVIRKALQIMEFTTLGTQRCLKGSGSKWISDADEIKATSGYVFTHGGGAISWESYK